MSARVLGLVSAVLAGCLPVHKSVRNHDTVVRQYEVEAERSAPEVQVKVASSTDRLELTAEAVVSCTREQKKVLKRWKETEKTTDTGLHALVYGLGAVAALGGGAVLFDTETAETADDRRIAIGSDLQTSRAVGASAAAAGGLLLVVGIASSIAATDERKFLGDIEEVVPGTRTTAECDRKPAANTQLALLMPAQAGKPSPVVALGTTDAQGKLVVAWANVQTPNGVRAEGEIVVGALDALRGDVAIGRPIKGWGRVAGPAEDPEVAWNAAVTANTPEAYEQFRAKFSASPRAADALERARAGRAKTALAKLDEALAAGNIDAAGEQMTILRANGDPQTVESAQARYETQRKATRIVIARQKMPTLLASIETAADPAPIVAEVKTFIDAIREQDADEAAKAQVQLDALRGRAVKRLLREGEDAFKRRDWATGTKKFDVATTIAIDVAPVARARTAAVASATRGALRQARSLARERRFDDAIAITDTLLAAIPNDATVTAEKALIVAAKERADKAAAAKADRDAARAEAAAQAQADKEARIAAAKQKLEDERARKEAARLAREEAARQKAEERRLRDEAARQQRIADAEARKRAAEEKRLAAEAARAQRRADAAAKKDAAQQERLAREAERARLKAEAEAKRADEALRKAEEARLRAEAARTGTSPLPPPVGVVQPTPATVKLPAVGSGIPPAKPLPDPVVTAPKPVAPTVNELAEARTHFTQAVALYGNGDYNTALVEFEASYRLNPQPFVLKNIGLTQKALFRYPEAIATLEKFLASNQKFAAPDPQETQKLISDMKALLAEVAITVSPDGAQITIDGRPVGLSPLPRVVPLASGTHSIEATAEGYKPGKRDVMVSAGVPLTVELNLELIPTKGKLRISSPVRRATVKIDGKPVGETPLEIELEQGGHRVEVSAPDYKPNASEVMVNAGQTREIGVPLEREPTRKKKWYMNRYVWAGAGAAVLGAVVLGVALSGTEAPIDGTLGTGSSGVP